MIYLNTMNRKNGDRNHRAGPPSGIRQSGLSPGLHVGYTGIAHNLKTDEN